jgi:hypothetical protein
MAIQTGESSMNPIDSFQRERDPGESTASLYC